MVRPGAWKIKKDLFREVRREAGGVEFVLALPTRDVALLDRVTRAPLRTGES